MKTTKRFIYQTLRQTLWPSLATLILTKTHTHARTQWKEWLTDVMLAAATISLFLTSRLQRMTVTNATTQTPRSGHRRRNTLQGSSTGSLCTHTHTHHTSKPFKTQLWSKIGHVGADIDPLSWLMSCTDYQTSSTTASSPRLLLWWALIINRDWGQSLCNNPSYPVHLFILFILQ